MERQWLADILTTQQLPFVAIWRRAAAAPFWVSGCLKTKCVEWATGLPTMNDNVLVGNQLPTLPLAFQAAYGLCKGWANSVGNELPTLRFSGCLGMGQPET